MQGIVLGGIDIHPGGVLVEIIDQVNTLGSFQVSALNRLDREGYLVHGNTQAGTGCGTDYLDFFQRSASLLGHAAGSLQRQESSRQGG